MNYTLRLIVISIFLSNMAFGGIFDSTRVVLPHQGSKALEFKLSGLFNFSGYIANGIAYKKFTENDRAVRYTLHTNISGYNEAGDSFFNNYSQSDSTIDSLANEYDYNRRDSDLMISMQWIKYLEPFNNLALLYGIGPIVGLDTYGTSRIIEADSISAPGSYIYQKDETFVNTLYTGAIPVIGIEWFLHQNFSFHAEYYTVIKLGWRFKTEYSKDINKTGYWNEDDRSYSGLYYRTLGYATAGISFYFK